MIHSSEYEIHFKQVKDEFCLRSVILEKHRYYKKKMILCLDIIIIVII